MTDPIRFANLNTIVADNNTTFSSEDSTDVFANVYDAKRNTYWTPTGNFDIDATNNKLYFNDGGNKTATIVVGAYATGPLLATQIETQMNAVSSSWAVSYSAFGGSTPGRFRIVRSSGSGTLQFSNQTNAIWDTIGFTTTVDLPHNRRSDQIRAHTTEWYMVDMGLPSQVRYVAMNGPSDEVVQYSASASVTLQGNNVDLWDSPPFEQAITVGDSGMFGNIPNSTNSIYRYWRVEIIDRENGSIVSSEGKISNIYLGDVTTPTGTNLASGFSRSQVDPSLQATSESGVIYFDTRNKYETFNGQSIQLLTTSDRNDLEQMFFDYGISTPFFVSIDPSIAVSDDIDDYNKWVYFAARPTFTHVFKNYYNMGLSLREGL